MATQYDEHGVKYLYTPFLKVDEEKRTVTGIASGYEQDLDGEGVDPDWLKTEFPDWFNRFGNIREMHQPKAAGVGTHLEWDDQGRPLLTSHIVDDDAWKKVKSGVYKGYSIGIKNTQKTPDPKFRNGRINGGKIIETSLVDRPAYDDALFTSVKYVIAREGDAPGGMNDMADTQKAVWTQKEMDALPDSSFAYVEPGGTKADRHLPYKDADGNIDKPHLRNALARLEQTDIPPEAKEKARTKLEAAAKEVGIDVGEDETKAAKGGEMGTMDDEMKAAMDEEAKAQEAWEAAKKKREEMETKRKKEADPDKKDDEGDMDCAKQAAVDALVALGADAKKAADAMYNLADMTVLKDIAALAAEMSKQTDKDDDGDIDTPANEEKPVEGGDIPRTQHVDEAAITARVMGEIMGKAAALIEKQVAAAISKYVTADTGKAGVLSPDVQKAFDELKDRVSTIENTVRATDVKTVAIERHVGMVQEQTSPKNAAEALEILAAKAARLGDAEQREFGAEAIKQLVYR